MVFGRISRVRDSRARSETVSASRSRLRHFSGDPYVSYFAFHPPSVSFNNCTAQLQCAPAVGACPAGPYPSVLCDVIPQVGFDYVSYSAYESTVPVVTARRPRSGDA